jgi:membrane protease YdiL (CAAX protease family)
VEKKRLRIEIVLVLGLSLGASAVYSAVSLLGKLTANKPLAQQHATLNPSQAPGRPWLDLTYQLLGIAFALFPAALALHLLRRDDPGALRVDRRPLFDLVSGIALAAGIGIPGLGLYVAARALGLNASVIPAALPDVWWAVPVLLLSAVQNAVVEEVIVIGYLLTRLQQLQVRLSVAIFVSAILRGSYHLYQGFGAFIGNVIMGFVFGIFYVRVRRLWPLIIAHAILDIVAFVGWTLGGSKLIH